MSGIMLTSHPSRTQRGPVGAGGGVVLLYHRVASLDFDPLLLSVTPSHFAEQLEVLSQTMQTVSLPEMAQRMTRGQSLTGSVTVTFDDGYADNLAVGAPLLARYGVPATVFVTSGYVGATREYWWDELERVLFDAVALPDALHMTIGGAAYDFDLDGSDASDLRDLGQWNVTSQADPTARHRLYRALFDLLRPLPHAVRDEALTELVAWSGARRHVRDSHRPLTEAQLRQLQACDEIEIGAHTVTHPVLSLLSAPAQRAEIRESKQQLEERIGCEVTSFAYPFGTRRDYTNDAVRAARDAGFDIACANVSGVVTPRADRMQLPRMLVRDWDGDTFAQKLREVGVGA